MMNGDVFVDVVMIVNFYMGWFICIFQILVYFIDGGKLINFVVVVDFGLIIYDYMRFQYGFFINFDLWFNNIKGINVGISVNYSVVFYNGGRMNKGGFINYELGFLVMSIYYGCFVYDFIVDQCNFFKVGQVMVCFFESDFYDYLIVWYYWMFKVCFINICEIIQFFRFQFINVFKCQNIGCLCYCFQNQYVW